MPDLYCVISKCHASDMVVLTCRFPLQEDAIDFAVKVAKDALSQNSRTLIVVGAYSIGKEKVYLGLAEALKVIYAYCICPSLP